MRSWLTLFVVFMLALASSACDDPYQQNDVELLVAHRAIYLCDCLYAMHMDLDYCSGYSAFVPVIDTFTVDEARKAVEAQALLLWSDRAHLEGERFGCIFD